MVEVEILFKNGVKSDHISPMENIKIKKGDLIIYNGYYSYEFLLSDIDCIKFKEI